jgi:hypothetical protein
VSEPKRVQIVCPDGKARTGMNLIEPIARQFLPVYNRERVCTKEGLADPCPGGDHRIEDLEVTPA